MALIMGITIPAGLEIIYNKTLKMYDISVLCNVGKNPRFFPRSKKYTLREVTYLFQIAYAWSFFSEATKDEWKYAANIMGQHGYNLYVEDKSYRIKHGIGGNATPSLYHQSLVGHLAIEAPATGAQVAQYNFTRVNFPASFELCFKTSLVAAGAAPSCRLKFIWTRYTQGQNIEATEIIDLPLVSGWDKLKIWITYQKGIRGKWRLELELTDVAGDLWFDNVFVEYSGEIKVNDPYCADVVKWWKGVSLPAGATLETIYPTGGAL
jgi:hypothetical protein